MTSQTFVDLSRWQFATTAAFHMTFPALSVGLAIFLVICYGCYYKTGNPLYLQMFRFWRKIFAVGFGLGIVSGIVLTFELGLNWGNYSRTVGPILGPMICMEALTAFFLEAGFIGILLYGEGRVSKRVTMVSTCMVALGALLSTAWILDANSWMQTPAGYREVSGQFQPVNWFDAIFNPAFDWRFPHMVLAVLVSASWFIAAIGAYYLLRRRALAFARKTMSIGLAAAAVLLPIQLYVGDSMATYMTAVYQPDKLIAARAISTTATRAGMCSPSPTRRSSATTSRSACPMPRACSTSTTSPATNPFRASRPSRRTCSRPSPRCSGVSGS
jgi:cytochrome d ubiquinol oxidase subunit I